MGTKKQKALRLPCAHPGGTCLMLAVPGETLCIAHLMAKPKRHKYAAKAVTIDGLKFDSTWESKRYLQLRLLEKSGAISGLQIHVRYALHVSGIVIGHYEADFVYVTTLTGKTDVEDAKGARTRLYIWKCKHLRAEYGIEVKEVFADGHTSIRNRRKHPHGPAVRHSRK